MTINDRFKEVRIVLGLSQEKFGQPLGLTKTSVSASENGLRVVSDRTVLLLHASFKVRVQWMYTGEGEMFENDGDDFLSELSQKYALNAFQQSLVRAVYELPPDYQDMILTLARRLVAENEETDYERIERVTNQHLAAYDAEQARRDEDKQA